MNRELSGSSYNTENKGIQALARRTTRLSGSQTDARSGLAGLIADSKLFRNHLNEFVHLVVPQAFQARPRNPRLRPQGPKRKTQIQIATYTALNAARTDSNR